ncbi:hypothetical protein ID866_6023 [Astraeus odoratus]|nr:hypothetical protein ID866_6023 [Astraeus odoratus]
MSAAQQVEKKGHICPPSNANHPSDRWESLFVYSFICKFTNLRGKVEGLETPMDFENALLSRGPDPILSRVLQQFILNLRPQTRNLSVDQISSTLSNVLADAFKGSERTAFWDDQLRANVDPFAKLEGDSPRVYVSTNPWKVTATFQTVSSTRVEYLAVIESLKAATPKNARKTKTEQAHLALIQALEGRIEVIDAELADDADEYNFEEEEEDDVFEQDDTSYSRSDRRFNRRASGTLAQRRSTRVTKGKRPSPEFSAHEWKGERRSSRFGAPEDVQLDRPPKRARTDENATSSGSDGWNPPAAPNGNSQSKTNGAAAVRPHEIAVEQVRGKKKSKYWFYAVEPIPALAGNGMPVASDSTASSPPNSHYHDGDTGLPGNSDSHFAAEHGRDEGMDLDRRTGGSLSPFAEELAENALRRLSHQPPKPRYRLKKNSFTRRTSTFATIPPSADDFELVSLFDQPRTNHHSRPLSASGIFQHTQLNTPAAFTALADSTLVRAQLLTERILRAPQSRGELFKVVKNLDRLSDLLCGVIDLAELLRNAHPDPQWVHSANDSYEKLCEYMNVLNTNVGLYKVLDIVLHDPEIVMSLSREAHQTALIFWRDFEKSAIRLPPESREKFVSLSSEILSLGHEFVTQASAPRSAAVIEASELEGLKDEGMGVMLRRQASSTRKNLLVYPGSHQAHMIMCSAPKESPRKKLYVAAHSSTPQQIECLERLLRARAELARLVGWDSYAGMTLHDKMAKTPENVSKFLDAFLDRTAIHAKEALHALRLRKQARLRTSTLPIIQAWDRSYYCPPEPPEPPIPLPPLSLGRVFMGLSRLFKHLYGVSLRSAEVLPGEVWHPDVHKLEVVDEDHGVIGWIYADLFARTGKASGAAHYTASRYRGVRCSFSGL